MILTRVNNMYVTREETGQEGNCFCLFDIPMHKHANYSYKNYVIYNLLWEPKTAEHVEIRIFVFWQMNKKLLNQLFILYFSLLTLVLVCKISKVDI